MFNFRSPFLFVLVLVCLFIRPAWGQSFRSVLSKLDQNYYYPQSQKLKSFSAQVKWQQLDVASGSGKFLRNPDLVFSWDANSDDGLGSFSLAETQEGERFRELIHHIYPYRELIIPLTLRQKFSNFKGRVLKMAGDKLMLKLKPVLDSSQNYKLLIDSKKYVIRKVRFQQSVSPKNVQGEMSYLKLDGKFAISESRSRFDVKGQKYVEVTRFNYIKVKGIWWVNWLDKTLTQDDIILQTHIFKFSKFRPILFARQ